MAEVFYYYARHVEDHGLVGGLETWLKVPMLTWEESALNVMRWQLRAMTFVGLTAYGLLGAQILARRVLVDSFHPHQLRATADPERVRALQRYDWLFAGTAP